MHACFRSSSSDSFLNHLDSEEHVADSKEIVPSLEEVRAPPQPLRRIRRGLAEEDLDAAGPTPAFASSTEYLDHVSFPNLDSLLL
jgi:hypothetical protein